MEKKFIIIAVVAVIAVVGIIGGLFMMNNGLMTPAPFKNNLDVNFNENKNVENPTDPIEEWVYTGEVTYWVYVSGFTDLTQKELLDLVGYTIDVDALDKNNNVLDSNSITIDQYIYMDSGKISFGQMEVDKKNDVDKVVVKVTNDNGNVIQTIEKQV